MRSIILFLGFAILAITNVPRIVALPIAESSPDAMADPFASPEPIFAGLIARMLGSAILRKVGTTVATEVASMAVEQAVNHAVDVYSQGQR